MLFYHLLRAFANRHVWLLLFFFAGITGRAKAQEQAVVFTSEKLEISTIIQSIQDQTPYTFGYESRTFDTSRSVELSSRRQTVRQALEAMTAGTDFSYMIRGRFIVINSTVRPRPESPRTSDVYQPSNPEDLADYYLRRRGSDSLAKESIVIEELTQNLPDPYSEIRPANLYKQLENSQPVWNIKTNLLYGAVALAPNLAVEFGLGPKTSLELFGSYNGWNRRGSMEDNKKMVHYTIRPEFRYWFCERYNGHFIGGNAFYTRFNVSEHEIPFAGFKKDKRYEGDAWGIGFTYGYQLPLSKRWSAEFSIGIGAAYMDYEQYDCTRCTRPDSNKNKFYVGPTRASVSLVFLIK